MRSTVTPTSRPVASSTGCSTWLSDDGSFDQARREHLEVLVERRVEQGAVEHGLADVVERDAPDEPILVLDDEAGAQTVVQALLNGGK